MGRTDNYFSLKFFTGLPVIWMHHIVWFLRKKIVLAIIFTSSLLYCIISLLNEPANVRRGARVKDDFIPPFKKTKSFEWNRDDTSDDNNMFTTCINSVQGIYLIVDNKGYVCNRTELLPNGCCNATDPTVKRYDCKTCNANNCCSSYEYCVSCCLNPNKKSLLRKIVNNARAGFRYLFYAVNDQFELCLTQCRTSSRSVFHENSYRDPHLKFCYGEAQPTIINHHRKLLSCNNVAAANSESKECSIYDF